MTTAMEASRKGARTRKFDLIDIGSAAKKLLGLSSLRPGQKEAIAALLRRQDTLVVQPTGSGKSAIYQIAGSLIPGVCVIVSPLIALQKDQVESIASSCLEESAAVNSTLSAGERRKTLDRIQGGEVEFIFLAPEQLCRKETVERLQSARVGLVAIDEAHCISQWGHDFRPDYLELRRFLEALGRPPCLAMTATASPEVRRDIVERLCLTDPVVLVSGFDRPNISLRVDTYGTKEEKMEAILRRVEFAEMPGIVYVATRKNAEIIAGDLRERGVQALAYHGGLKAKDRENIQNSFMSGEVPVIVATNAFGMGIDKADIRFVYHADSSESLDSYYQEIGRAGRDGEAAEAILFYRPGEIRSQSYRAASVPIDMGNTKSTIKLLMEREAPITVQQIIHAVGLSKRTVINTIHQLVEVHAIAQMDDGKVCAVRDKPISEILEATEQQQQFQRELRRHRLEQMREYATARACRRAHLLQYFGDSYSGPCGNCDRCQEIGIGNQNVA